MTGKCNNLGNCVLAYRGEQVTAPEDSFVCPECGQPLTPAGGAKKGSWKQLGPMLMLGAIVVGLCLLVFIFVVKLQRVEPGEGAGTEERVTEAEPEAAETAAPPRAEAVGEVPQSGQAAVPENLNLDAQAEENAEVKSEVLKRIDLMPTISADEKDKLYFSVERARQMGKIIMIPFGFGQRTLSEAEISALREALATSRVQKVLQDPTAVLVVLGYADIKGDEDKNLKISQDRAEAVLNALRDKLGVLNIMHAVGMGSSTLFDESGNEKNRVAEVWVALP